jgi:type IV pilus assembly protein PilB
LPKAFDKGFRWVTDPSVQAEDEGSAKKNLEQESPPDTEESSKQGPVQGSGQVDQGKVSAWRPARSEPVINFVDSLIATAVNEGASDIHIEPREKELHVRLRIDGVLFQKPAPPIKMHPAIISRLKILANLDISERRLPQDGRIRANVGGKQVDLRISMLPLSHGEKCVIRVLDSHAISVGLEQLGMAESTLEAFRSEILQPHGVVLVTGPTGSGKSTTLYSALQVMDGSQLNICTVEDPVEYDLKSVNQVQVHESIGMTFAAALRSLLRQDPDTIMVGEIRDEETARVAVQAALTGHMVLSTLHTNDAPSSITRLIDIGIESYLISAAVNGALAQRLLRRICENCKEELTVMPEATAVYLEEHNAKPGTLYCGTGCEICRNTGYKGRIGIYELMILNQELRDIITRTPSLGDLKAAAKAQGMRTLRDDGLAKAFQGQTTVDELIRITES